MRKGFTLIELIFVIVIIGILAAAAIPRFVNLKQSAEANNVIKVVMDAASAVPASCVAKRDLEGISDINLTDVIEIKSKGWQATNNNKTYEYYSGTNKVVEMNLSVPAREFNISIDCQQFDDTKTQEICAKDLNISTTDTYFQNIQF